MGVLIGVFILAGLICLYIWDKANGSPSEAKPKSANKGTANKNTAKKKPQDAVFKKAEVLSYNMEGLDYLGLDPDKYAGSFIGTAVSERNSNDKFAVNIYNRRGKVIGFFPKRQIRLHNTIQQQYGGKVVCWGSMEFAPSQGKWGSGCFVNVTVGISKENLDKIEQYLYKLEEFRTLSSKDGKNSEDYLRVLELHDILQSYEEELKGIHNTAHKFNSSIVPSMSKHFEENNEWENLLKLDEYQDLINRVNQKKRDATLRRIEKAKAKTAE